MMYILETPPRLAAEKNPAVTEFFNTFNMLCIVQVLISLRHYHPSLPSNLFHVLWIHPHERLTVLSRWIRNFIIKISSHGEIFSCAL